jgi:glutamate formiminotransferase
MNIVDYDQTALYRVSGVHPHGGGPLGITVNGTEVYGMIPARAILDSAAYYLPDRRFRSRAGFGVEAPGADAGGE